MMMILVVMMRERSSCWFTWTRGDDNGDDSDGIDGSDVSDDDIDDVNDCDKGEVELLVHLKEGEGKIKTGKIGKWKVGMKRGSVSC